MDYSLFLFDFSFPAIGSVIVLKVLVTAYTAVLFLQSGFDKVTDWSGNVSYFKQVFAKTFLRHSVSLLMPVITALEVSAGICSAIGAVMILTGMGGNMAKLGVLLGAISILCLFGGLRIAKDYGGAAAITSYFIFFVLALLVVMD